MRFNAFSNFLKKYFRIFLGFIIIKDDQAYAILEKTCIKSVGCQSHYLAKRRRKSGKVKLRKQSDMEFFN